MYCPPERDTDKEKKKKPRYEHHAIACKSIVLPQTFALFIILQPQIIFILILGLRDQLKEEFI